MLYHSNRKVAETKKYFAFTNNLPTLQKLDIHTGIIIGIKLKPRQPGLETDGQRKCSCGLYKHSIWVGKQTVSWVPYVLMATLVFHPFIWNDACFYSPQLSFQYFPWASNWISKSIAPEEPSSTSFPGFHSMAPFHPSHPPLNKITENV